LPLPSSSCATEPNLPRKFLCPGVPYVPALAVIFCVFLMAQRHAHLAVLRGVAGNCLVVYFGYSRKNSHLHKQALIPVLAKEKATSRGGFFTS
jgi:hypothetical protein